MTVAEMAKSLSLDVIVDSEDHREISGVYIGDLLSWVMGRAQSGNVWITIMSNINVVAVASLADVSCVVLAEGVTLSREITETAKQKGVNIYSSPKDAYELAVLLSDVLK
jgi:hypothetical protein